MLIVLDTNVLGSGLLKRNSNPGKIIDAILNGKLQLVIDKRILKEYHDVLHRPKFEIPNDQIDSILSFIAFSSLWTECQPVDFSRFEIFDAEDLPFAELAINKKAILISGNLKHYHFLQKLDVDVIQPGDFVSKFRQQFL